MASLAHILRRFRFQGVPGAPSATAVPVDRTADIERELEPVFSALSPAQRRAARTVATAERDAQRLRQRAHDLAERIVVEARSGADAARAEAAATRLSEAERERARLLAAGRTEADRIAMVAVRRMPALVSDAVARVLSSLSATPNGTVHAGPMTTASQSGERSR